MDAVVDLQLFGSTRENLVGRLGALATKRAAIMTIVVCFFSLKASAYNYRSRPCYKNQVTAAL